MPTPVSTGSLTIADLNDGLYALLSSETGLVHCDSAGTPTTPLTTAPLTTMMTVYKGNSVQTGFSFTRTASSGVTSNVNASGVLSVTGLTTAVDGGWVDIVASKAGEPSLTKRYVISKVKQGIQGGVGPVGQGIDSITEQYAISTSKTTPPAEGSTDWKDVAPTWSTGKYLWTRSKIVYKNPTDTKYTTPVCDSSWEAAIEVGKDVEAYVQSRGENLVTNGSGLLGNNKNFSHFTYDGSEAYYSSGSFKYVGAGTKFTDEFMPVNPEIAYKLSMFAKTAEGTGRYYAMVGCFDVDNHAISAQHHMYRANTLTTLAQELKNGDTVVYLADASNWYNDGTAGVNTHLRSIIIWNYKNSYGYQYPPLTYSRNWTGNAWNPNAINFSNNTITLRVPWSGGTVEAGTQLSNGSSGGTYKYLAMSNTNVPTTWTEYTGIMDGIDLSGTNSGGKFPPGTAKTKIGWLLNYQGSGETIWIANVSFSIHVAKQSDLDSTNKIVDKSIKSSDVEYYLSTSSTSLSGGAWQTTAPDWVDGKFMWTRTKTTLNDGTVSYSPSSGGTCIAGAKGATGSPGTSITSVDVEYAISISSTTAPTTGWSTASPAWEDGKFMWSRVKTSYSVGEPTYTNPACITGAAGPKGDTGEQGPTGEPGQMLGLNADTSVITVSPRGELRTEEIIFSVNTHDIADLSAIEWKLSYEENTGDGLDYVYLSESVIDYSKRVLNCNTVFVDNFTLSVTYTVGTRTYSDSLAISKVIDGNAPPVYLDVSATVPVITSEGALIQDDFFLYIGPYLGNGTAPTEEDLEEYHKDGRLTEVPASVNNEFIYGRLYKYVGQESAACTIGQTASNSIIISNAAALVYVVGLTVYLNSEPTRRTITGITTHDVNNKKIALSGAAFDTTTDSLIYIDVWSESRDSKHLSVASTDALEIARSSGVWLYCAVLVAQLGLFGELLIENELRSTNYASHMEGSGDEAKEVPDMGFKLNGKLGEILAYAMRAYEAEIFGNLTASGFKTLQEQAGRTIPVASVTPTLWKHSEMEALIASQDTLATLSGTIEGFSFNKATRRSNQRVLLASHGYESESISAGETHYFTQLYPSKVFGLTFRCDFSGYYSGLYSNRGYWAFVAEANSNLTSAHFIRSMGESYAVNASYSFPSSAYTNFTIKHYSGALWGNRGSHVDYHKVWTNQVFTGLVLVNGETSFKVIEPEPSAYYPTTKTWTIGSYNQNSIANYCSGTDFYNLFSSLAIGADGFCDGGQINVNGTLYTVTRLTKAANSITFYTSGGVITVNKFQEGTNVGVYTALAVTQAINFQAVVGGIEVKHILPWGTQAGSPGSYDLGTSDARFNTLWLKILDVLNAVRFRSTLQVDGAASMASINTGGLGAFLIGQNLRTTDSPTFATVNATDVITTNGPNKPVDNNDSSMPSVNVGGFSYATASSGNSIPAVTLGSGGTWVWVAYSYRGISSLQTMKLGRSSGGSTVAGSVRGNGDENGYVHVIGWRIA